MFIQRICHCEPVRHAIADSERDGDLVGVVVPHADDVGVSHANAKPVAITQSDGVRFAAANVEQDSEHHALAVSDAHPEPDGIAFRLSNAIAHGVGLSVCLRLLFILADVDGIIISYALPDTIADAYP